ncbi:unnamed protein product [Calicophoron daubneyi]|uniref:Acid sphingomyelinase-like phosphodiesterase 3b n=1 Tax=Calicophoron daubneyi TaxID=300641 RepID=A0AAV2TC94_CALDB
MEVELLIVIALSLGVAEMAADDDIGYFWQLTDLHMEPNYTSLLCKGSFGDYRCDSPLELVRSAINATQLFCPNNKVDFVVWSGDGGPHRPLLEVEFEDILRNLSQLFRKVFTDKVYVLPVLGNHDVRPANQMQPGVDDPDRLKWCHKLASDSDLWGPWIHLRSFDKSLPTPPPANFSKGCFFSHILRVGSSRLLLISLNGLIWYTGNPAADKAGPDPLNQLEWFNNSCSWARQNGCKVLLVSHFPPGASENTPKQFRFLRDEVNERFVHLLETNADVIMTSLFAHEHVDSFRVLSSSAGVPLLSLLLGPSISPMHLSGLGSFNPRIRLYWYKRSVGVLLGYAQYFLDLSDQRIQSIGPQWTLEYNTSVVYNLKDLSPASLSRLLDVFAGDDTPNGSWSAYWKYELGGRPHDEKPGDLDPGGLCPRSKSPCRCEHLCPMRYLNLTAMDQCLASCLLGQLKHAPSVTDTAPTSGELSVYPNRSEINATNGFFNTERNSLPIVIGVIIAFLGILVGVVLVVNREICRKRGRYSRGLGNNGGSIGGMLFSSMNGAFPSVLRGDTRDVYNTGEGSCTELRTAFHPDYCLEDERYVEDGQITDKPPPHMNGYLHGPMDKMIKQEMSRNGLADGYACQASQDLQLDNAQPSVESGESHLANDRIYPPLGLRTRSKSPKTRYSVPDFSVHNSRFIPPGSISRVNEHGSVVTTEGGRNVVRPVNSTYICPTEDYYADDEAFGDEEEGSELIRERSDQGNDSEPYSSSDEASCEGNGGHSFQVDQGSTPLSKSRSIKELKKSKNGRNEPVIVEDPLAAGDNCTSPSNHSSPDDHTSPSLFHSRSVTFGQDSLAYPVRNEAKKSCRSAAATSPRHEALYLKRLSSGHTNEPVDGLCGEPSLPPANVHGTPTYDYVRI